MTFFSRKIKNPEELTKENGWDLVSYKKLLVGFRKVWKTVKNGREILATFDKNGKLLFYREKWGKQCEIRKWKNKNLVFAMSATRFCTIILYGDGSLWLEELNGQPNRMLLHCASKDNEYANGKN